MNLKKPVQQTIRQDDLFGVTEGAGIQNPGPSGIPQPSGRVGIEKVSHRRDANLL